MAVVIRKGYFSKDDISFGQSAKHKPGTPDGVDLVYLTMPPHPGTHGTQEHMEGAKSIKDKIASNNLLNFYSHVSQLLCHRAHLL